MAGELIKVLIVDDHERVRQALRIFLELWDDVEVVGEASNGQEAIGACEHLHPDVVLMDLIMPVMDGVQASSIITQRFPDIRIVILTSSVDHDMNQTIKQTGAKKYVLKTSPPDKLADAIREVMN